MIVFMAIFLICCFFVVIGLISSAGRKAALQEEYRRRLGEVTSRHEGWDESLQEELAHLADARMIIAERAMQKWRQTERLSHDVELFPVGGVESGVFSLYSPIMTPDERDLFQKIRHRFNAHCIFVDSYFRRPDGGTAQIDIIAVSRRGIFVIESKGYHGWIFGNANNQKWTQVLAYGHEKRLFYNPIKQNASHIKVLLNEIGLPRAKVFSLVVFGDGCEIKSADFIPRDCYVLKSNRIHDVMDNILSGDDVLSGNEVLEIAHKISSRRVTPTPAVRNGHIAQIRDMLGTDRIYQ
jgi:hypothetical protein